MLVSTSGTKVVWSLFRRDILIARITHGVVDAKEGQELGEDLPSTNSWACPWVKLICMHSGTPVPYRECVGCEFGKEVKEVSVTVTAGATEGKP